MDCIWKEKVKDNYLEQVIQTELANNSNRLTHEFENIVEEENEYNSSDTDKSLREESKGDLKR